MVTSYPKEKINILLLENIHQRAYDLFAQEGFHVELLKQALSEEELCERMSDVHVLGIRSKTQITQKVLEHAPRLLTLGCFCIGTNQVDLGAANLQAVPVFNAPFSNTRSVAELVIAEIVMLSRQLGDRSREVHAGKWNKVARGAHEIRGKTLGIIGYGHIGSQVGVLAEMMGMRVVFHDVVAKLPMGNNHAALSLQALLAESDYVTLHVPGTPSTVNLMGEEQIGWMKEGSHLINASRGNVVDIPALAKALRDGRLSGAAVDVFPQEPKSNDEPFESELRGLPNVVLTPHIGGSTEEAQANIGTEVASALISFVNTGSTAGAVNFPNVDLPETKGAHRILNVHRNVPGVMRDINRIVSDLDANIHAQVLGTDPNLGYLIMDLNKNVSEEVRQQIRALDTNVRTRILF